MPNRIVFLLGVLSLCLFSESWVPAFGAEEKPEPPPPAIAVAEGERFSPVGEEGWRVVGQDESYATQTFGAMWVTHGGLLKADV